MPFPTIRPQPLVRIPAPFKDPAWIWELKLDGFRALAYLEDRDCRLVSRNGHTYRTFDRLRTSISSELKLRSAILDGEIVCLDGEGRSQFNPLLFRRCNPVFAAFDVLWSGGRDLRPLPLMERKRVLRELVPSTSTAILHIDCIREKGKELFELACGRDLEGVVGKWAEGTYQSDGRTTSGRTTSWVKVKNAGYSQIEGRADLFDKKPGARRSRPPVLMLR